MADTTQTDSRSKEEGTSKQRVARVYAEALLQAAEEKQQAEAIAEELNAFVTELLDQHPELETALASPTIKKSEKAPVIEKSFKDKVSPLLFNFLMVLNSKDRLGLLRLVNHSYRDLLDGRSRRIRVTVRSVVALTADQTEHLRQAIGVAYGREPIIVAKTDASILGGMIVQIGDQVFDGSVRTSIDNIRNQLMSRSSHEIQVGRDRFSTAG
jgi:F-type H+-transporting ATPase subunit delta